MRIGRMLIVGTLCALASLLAPARSEALFHISAISEVLASLDGDASQQFIEVEMLFAAQTFVSNAVIASFDANGTYIEDILILPNDLANGQNGGHWIVATSAFQSAHAFTADFTMPAKIPLGGGMVCWGAPGLLPPKDPTSWDHTDPANYVDCLAYGTYSGPTNHLIGNPTPLVAEGHSLARQSETDDNAADFACADTATPTNNAGQTVQVPATTPCGGGGRASGIQVTPDENGVLVNKDVGDQRWTITRNLDDSTVTGNVFSPGGGDPLFLFCEQTGESGDNLELNCSGANGCSETECPAFAFIADVELPKSFFTPPVDVAGIGSRIQAAVSAAATQIAAPQAERARGITARASGIQITPDDERVLVNKDVQDQRWSITRNLGDLTVTGNVFSPGGGAPLFLFCEQQGMDGTDLQLHCSAAGACSATACPPFAFIADVTLPESFFAVPSPSPGASSTPAPTASPAVTVPAEPTASETPTPTATPAFTAPEDPQPSDDPPPTPTPYSYPYP